MRERDIHALQECGYILDYSSEFHDFPDTASLCDLMDIIISVDTSVAHLNAALGKKTWIMLPFALDWRWLLNRDDSPWHQSAKLYRQSSPKSWNSVFEIINYDLKSIS